MKKAIAGVMFSLLSPLTFAASFDCLKATTSVETMICGSTELSELDSVLGNLYKTEAAHEQKEQEQGVQRAWLKERNRCQDVACLTGAYGKRIRELKHDVLDETDSISGEYAFGSKNGYQGRGNVIKLSAERFRYFYEITSGEPSWHTGNAYGEAKLVGQNARTIPAAGRCLIEFKFKDNKMLTALAAKQSDPANCLAGARVSLEAKFNKVERKD